MKKFFTFFAALTMVMSMFAAKETVYFVNALKWEGTINAYAWTDGTTNAGWPGAAATKEAPIEGCDVYSFTAEAGTYAKIIFNNGKEQTSDLVWTAGKYYVKDGWYTKEEVAAQLAKPQVDVYIVAGVKNLMGVEWNNSDASNKMTQQTDGSYKLVKKAVTLAVGTYEYKVVKNYSWNTAYPGENAKLEIKTAGKYDVTFTFVPKTEEVSATATIAGGTAVENVEAEQLNTKFIYNGQIVVRYNGKLYNVMGQEVKE